ncbi:hypothetical protein QOZ80_5AG0397440 [Eleusine coracana subsp. coracana]|nr:hypothetical protein QOZ80_5AG0397440 [Eleusine coracana subsp. coracana]
MKRPAVMASHLLLVSIVVFSVTAIGQDDKILQPIALYCSPTGNYTHGSQYQKNLADLLATMPAVANENGWFLFGRFGADADQVFGLIMCFADWNAKQCQDCLTRAPAGIASSVCPGSRRVDALYDACVLRYADAPLPAAADLAVALTWALVDPGIPVSSEAVQGALLPLMSQITDDAAASPLRLAYNSTRYSSSQDMYGMAQCTRDLTAGECSRCIANYTEFLHKRFPNYTGAFIKGYSCYLIYRVGRGFNITLPPPSMESGPGSSSSYKTGLVIGLSVGSVLIILCSLACLIFRRRRKQAAKMLHKPRQQELKEGTMFDDEPGMEDEFEKGTGPKRFRYIELTTATDNFSDEHKLGEGGFGSVYRGFLTEMSLAVAIKRVSKSSKQGRKEFAAEVRIISRLRHRNLVQLIGWCHDGGELLLVYELMPNGSLDTHLHSSGSDDKDTLPMPWPRRHEIVLGIASAVLYLHQEWEQCVVRRDIKPSNVMLDASFNAKLGDFGLARLIDDGRQSHTTHVAGTFGYMDPECMVIGKANMESDVYSFGVLLLEVVCGRRPAVRVGEDDFVHLVQWVWDAYAVDARLEGEFDGQEVASTMIVGLWCAHPDRELPPTIRQAVNVLRFEAPPPSLPAKMPIATYGPPAGCFGSGNAASSSSAEGTADGGSTGNSTMTETSSA